ncbi:EamA family transporter [Rhodopseudomonas boonkerdii]|uniref:EamA family transporter n=1 Tax=Rhodopseudomonas boonkerdii TaxID=475937 RepID=UPI001E2A4E31|nr:EamA family transporter [Rhodopseudomonas boonkerdii]UGV25809.1 EamA family transporter [Rhodopseudomonas boonkerdii]
MKPLDIALAVAVAVIWGVGFVLTRMAVDEMSSTLITTLRFAITALPCLLLPRPKLPWQVVVATSWLLVAQFLAQTYGMAHGVPAGLTSVIVQSQALFTVGLAALLLKEWPTRQQAVGIVVAMAGLMMICFTVGYDFSVFPFMVLMTAPISFAFSNLLLRRAQGVPMLDLFSWISLVALAPLLVVLFTVDGAATSWHSLTHASLKALACVAFLAVVGTTLGYWIWGRLLRDYSAAQVVPFALLVPFVGAVASSFTFGESFGSLRLTGMIVVVLGIAVMLLSRRPPVMREVA